MALVIWTLYLRSQVGTVSDHVPLVSQVRVVLPERVYPELQLYVAVDMNVVIVKVTSPFWGLVKVPQSTAAGKVSCMLTGLMITDVAWMEDHAQLVMIFITTFVITHSKPKYHISQLDTVATGRGARAGPAGTAAAVPMLEAKLMNLIKGRLQKFRLSNNFSVNFTRSRAPAALPDQSWYASDATDWIIRAVIYYQHIIWSDYSLS